MSSKSMDDMAAKVPFLRKRCVRTIEMTDLLKFYNLKTFARCRESGIIVIGQCLSLVT